MSATASAALAHRIADDPAEFFPPVDPDFVAALLTEYAVWRERVEKVSALFGGELGGVVRYFVDGNAQDGNAYSSVSAERIFARKGAVGALNSDHWQRLLDKTDVLACMPQARRDEWYELIRSHGTPDFEPATVKATLADLLGSRAKFFAERVDGIFRNLSGEHVTNSPSGFKQRMIIAGITESGWYTCTRRCGYIHDLRVVIARFMGRGEPAWNATSEIVKHARDHRGQWITIDGGALRVRVYKVGTAHLEVCEEMAYRLNCVLHSLYPTAIASEHRTKPKKTSKDFTLYGRPLPFQVLGMLASMGVVQEIDPNGPPPSWNRQTAMRPTNSRRFEYGENKSRPAKDEARAVLECIGGVVNAKDRDVVDFDYDPTETLTEIIITGCIPDQVAHQFYPTPDDIARRAVGLAEIDEHHTCLEPSAGQGGLAGFMPIDRTTCVEISKTFSTVLKAKGHTVDCVDFMRWTGRRRKYDRIVMNPPFSEGRWLAHLEHAAGLLADGGRLVAILPASTAGKDVLPGWSLRWSEPIAFAGTSIDVVILVAERSGA